MLTLILLFIGLNVAGKALAWVFGALLAYELFIETPYRLLRRMQLENRREQRFYKRRLAVLEGRKAKKELERFRRSILTKVVDAAPYLTIYEGGSGNITTVLETIGALIAACDEFGDESDVEWVCGQLTELQEPDRADPFDLYEYFYGVGAFKGKRLKFLRDARVTSGKFIKNDIDAIQYIRTFWGDRNEFREVTQPIYPVKVVDGRLEYLQVMCRPLSSASGARLYLFPPTMEVDGEALPVSTPYVLPTLRSPPEIERPGQEDFATLVVPDRLGCIPGVRKSL